jgi:IclR family transcriptional regulator, KDG regulon repressor
MARTRAIGPDAATHAEAATAPRERAGVQSLERAFAILEEVAHHAEGIGLADLSRRVGLHNSTTFHLVKTMVALGYIRQPRDTKRYHLGRRLFGLAASARSDIDLVAIATPILEDLARATGESCHLAIRSGDEVVVVVRIAGTGAFQLQERHGGVRPAHATALGKVLLAALQPAQLERFLATHPLEPCTAKTITEPERLRGEIAQARAAGIAYDDGEFNAEVRCVAVPVHDFTGQVAAALGISGPVWRLTLQSLQETSAKVQAAADRLSAELGAAGRARPDGGETPR